MTGDAALRHSGGLNGADGVCDHQGINDPFYSLGVRGGANCTCLHEACRAFSIVEGYILSMPALSAVDQLCLNHVRDRLRK